MPSRPRAEYARADHHHIVGSSPRHSPDILSRPAGSCWLDVTSRSSIFVCHNSNPGDRVNRSHRILLFVILIFAFAATSFGQQSVDPKLYEGIKWRLVGPFRGGRVLTGVGVPSQPNTYYFGAVSGGVWKTTDGGITWEPL